MLTMKMRKTNGEIKLMDLPITSNGVTKYGPKMGMVA